jgi:tetratricopeptide (TPR) repeat protein
LVAVADAGYRERFANWRTRVERIIAAASQRYEHEFSLALKLCDCREWPFLASLAEREQLNEQLFKIPLDEAEIAVAFVEKTPTVLLAPGEHTEGYAFPFGRHVVVGDVNAGTAEAEMVLIHELAHVFGAFHVDDPKSIMQMHLGNVPTRFNFDEPTTAVIRLTRNVDLRAGVDSLDAKQVSRLRGLFQAHGRPDGRVDEEEPVVMGLLHRAHCQRLEGNLARARGYVLRARDLSPDSGKTQLALAELAIAQGDSEEALRRFEAAATLNPENVDALLELARLRLQLGKFNSALRVAERAAGIEARLRGKSERTILLRAYCRFLTADDTGYGRDLRYLKRNHPASAAALLRNVDAQQRDVCSRQLSPAEDVDDAWGWPPYDHELDGLNEIRVENPHNFPVVVGLRCDREGQDFAVAPRRVRKVNVHAGKIHVFFRHRDYPEGVFQGDSFSYHPEGGQRKTRTICIPKPQSRER